MMYIHSPIFDPTFLLGVTKGLTPDEGHHSVYSFVRLYRGHHLYLNPEIFSCIVPESCDRILYPLLVRSKELPLLEIRLKDVSSYIWRY